MRKHWKTVLTVVAAVVLSSALGPSISALAQNVACYMEQGGARWVAGSGCSIDVASGGEIDIESGGALKIGGSDRTTALSTAPAGVAAGYKIARGTITLDGSNPSSAATGLTAIVACAVTNKRSDTPGLDPTDFTIATAAVAGRLDIYAWKPTAADNALLTASTDSDDTIDWVCIGT